MRVAIGAALCAVLLAVGVGPAAADEDLGLEITPTSGQPGDIVATHVDPAEVAADCLSTVETFQNNVGRAVLALRQRYVDEVYGGEAPPRGTVEGDKLHWFEVIGGFTSGSLKTVVWDLASTATVADSASGEPLGEAGTFDMATGAGSVTVPAVAPGGYSIVVACYEAVSEENIGADDAYDAFVEAFEALPDDIMDVYPGHDWGDAALAVFPLLLTERASGTRPFEVVGPHAPNQPEPPQPRPATPVRRDPNVTG